MLKRLKIGTRLFVVYSLLIGGTVAVLAVQFYQYTGGLLRDAAYDTIAQIAENITNQLDREIENLDDITTKVIFSQNIKGIFFEKLAEPGGLDAPANQHDMSNEILSIIGPMALRWQVNIVDQSGILSSVGEYTQTVRVPPERLGAEWLEDAYRLQGSRSVSAPHPDAWGYRADEVISVSRCFGRSFEASKTAVVEAQVGYRDLVGRLEATIRRTDTVNTDQLRLIITDSRGRLIYATPGSEADQLLPPGDDGNGVTDLDGWVRASRRSQYTGWSTLVALPQRVLFQPLAEFGRMMLVTLVGVLSVTLLISFAISRSLTGPIQKMYRSVMQLRRADEEETRREMRTANELQVLVDAFEQLHTRLDEYMELSVTMRTKEAEARFAALQAQMKPHFLYNTISTISILAEGGQTDSVIQVCGALNLMMQYILADDQGLSTIRDEIAYTESYLQLMGIRFERLLEWSIDIEERILPLGLPKLTIQPLVENCVKYARERPPPWRIRIRGSVADGHWTIEVEDNGAGFDSGVLALLQSDAALPTKKGRGLGLRSTRERLGHFFGDDLLFGMENLAGGGARVWFSVALGRSGGGEGVEQAKISDGDCGG